MYTPLCHLNRWITSFGRCLASEKSMRERAGELLPKDNLKTEWAPLTVQHKDGEEVKHVPTSFIPNLWQQVQDMLEQSAGRY